MSALSPVTEELLVSRSFDTCMREGGIMRSRTVLSPAVQTIFVDKSFDASKVVLESLICS
jgi:hypothetical protein